MRPATPLFIGRQALRAGVCIRALAGIGIPGSLSFEFQGSRYNPPLGFGRTEAVLMNDPADPAFADHPQLQSYAKAHWSAGTGNGYITREEAMGLPPAPKNFMLSNEPQTVTDARH